MRKDFSGLPSVSFNRARFDLSHIVKTSMDVGYLYPISIREVIPGDSFKCDITALARVSSSFIKPVMDNAYIDIYSFFVPYRLCYDKAQQVFGKASPSMYVDEELEKFPTTSTNAIVYSGTVGDYLGLPVGGVPAGISILPFRAFARVWNEWFRDENVVNETYVQPGEFADSEMPNNSEWSANNYTGKLPRVSKRKDYFTSCLPKTQKGNAVNLSVGNITGESPVFTSAQMHANYNTTIPLKFQPADGTMPIANQSIGLKYNEGSTLLDTRYYNSDPGGDGIGDLIPANLWASSNGLKVDPISVNDLRFAVQFQKMLERDARYGSRYNEFLLGHFGVSNPDSRLQFTEFLGGGRIPISVEEVRQTSQSTEQSPLANVGALSLSIGRSRFRKGFTEHGYVLTVACIRTFHTYCQGVPRMFMRSERNDFYDPLWATLGEQPVYTNELYVESVKSPLKGNIFGYNEAWADYRYAPNILTGKMRTNLNDSESFAIWHFGDKYDSRPYLSANFIQENGSNFKRTVSAPTAPDFLVDFAFKNEAIRVMPIASIPGLLDHH